MALKCKHSAGNGTIYIQIFPHGKKYIGQTIRGSKRFEQYRRHKGNNPHHTNALKKYDYNNVKVLTFDVPEFLLDYVETSLISLYDTTDRAEGYNKQTGGTNGRHSQETIEKMCGRKHTQEAKKKMSIVKTGLKRTEETKQKKVFLELVKKHLKKPNKR